MARGSVQLRHRKTCPASGRDTRACRCGPTVYAVLGRQWAKIGYLPVGWVRRDLAPFEDKLIELRQSLEAGENWRPRKPMRLSEYADGWFDELYAAAEAGRIAKRTHDHYVGAWERHLDPAFGQMPLAAIDQPAIRRFVADKAKRLKPGSIKYVLSVLSAMLTDAVAEGLIVANPARQPRMARHGASRRRLLYLPVEQTPPKHLEPIEARALLAATDEGQARELVFAALVTGFRRGELLGVRWEDIQWADRRIQLTGQLQGRERERCKNRSEREVVLYSGLARVLGKRRQAAGYVFTDATGRPWATRDPGREILAPAYDRAGLRRPGQMWHLLRHTYCSILANAGIRREVVERLMGHAPRGSTTTLYTHLFRDAFDGVEEALDGVFGVNQTSTECSVSTDNDRTPVNDGNGAIPLPMRDSRDVAVSGDVR
jgi:integrase